MLVAYLPGIVGEKWKPLSAWIPRDLESRSTAHWLCFGVHSQLLLSCPHNSSNWGTSLNLTCARCCFCLNRTNNNNNNRGRYMKTYLPFCGHFDRSPLNVYRSEKMFGAEAAVKNEARQLMRDALFPSSLTALEIIKRRGYLCCVIS
jgi:hypothetical protein